MWKWSDFSTPPMPPMQDDDFDEGYVYRPVSEPYHYNPVSIHKFSWLVPAILYVVSGLCLPLYLYQTGNQDGAIVLTIGMAIVFLVSLAGMKLSGKV